MLYYLVDKFLMPDFCDQISSYVNKNKKQIVFDVGCFKGTFSIKLKKKIPNSKFYLFDPSPISQITNFNNNLLSIIFEIFVSICFFVNFEVCIIIESFAGRKGLYLRWISE